MEIMNVDKFQKLRTERKPKEKFSEKEEYLIKVQEHSIRYNWNVHNTNQFVKYMARAYNFTPKELRNEAMARANRPVETRLDKILKFLRLKP